MTSKRSFWLTLALANLCLVAFLGFTLRSKILFPLNFVDFRSVESAHSHFAFAGWVGLALITLFVYDVLPEPLGSKKIYQWILVAIETSSLGMAFLFPFVGYAKLTILFSDLYVIAAVVFIPVFIRDVIKMNGDRSIKLLSVSAVVSLLLSFIGTAGLAYIIVTRSGASLLYRDSIYVFLHFQYNGFFTLSVFALLINYLIKKGISPNNNVKWFSVFLCLSIIPALFLSLLWHNLVLFYILGALGCLFILLALIYFYRFLRVIPRHSFFTLRLAKTFWIFSMISFALKMLLQIGTIFPQLGNAVYGDRPVIIGFLHLVFLGFVTFFLLSRFIEDGYFNREQKVVALPLVWFAIGIFANEFFLMLQGLGVLLQTNSDIYKWLLWGAAIILFTGALFIAITRLALVSRQKNKVIPEG